MRHAPNTFYAPPFSSGAGEPQRRPRSRRPERSFFGRMLWTLLFLTVRGSAVLLGVLVGWLVIAGGLMLWFMPAQIFGWIWAALFILPGSAIGLVAFDCAAAVIRLTNKLGDRLLYGRRVLARNGAGDDAAIPPPLA